MVEGNETVSFIKPGPKTGQRYKYLIRKSIYSNCKPRNRTSKTIKAKLQRTKRSESILRQRLDQLPCPHVLRSPITVAVGFKRRLVWSGPPPPPAEAHSQARLRPRLPRDESEVGPHGSGVRPARLWEACCCLEEKVYR
jgi:hypothetical protein